MWFLWPPDKTSAYKSVSECVCVFLCISRSFPCVTPMSHLLYNTVCNRHRSSYTCVCTHMHTFLYLCRISGSFVFFALSLTALIFSSFVFTHYLVIWLTSSSSHVTFSLLSLVLLKKTLALALLKVLFASLLYSASSFLFSSPWW